MAAAAAAWRQLNGAAAMANVWRGAMAAAASANLWLNGNGGYISWLAFGAISHPAAGGAALSGGISAAARRIWLWPRSSGISGGA